MQFKDADVRKAIYLKMVPFWPTGMMDTASLSKQYSSQKRKREREAESGILLVEQEGYTVRVDPFLNVANRRPKLEKEDDRVIIKRKPSISTPDTSDSKKSKIAT